AAHLGADHRELLVGPGDFDLPALVDQLVAQYDEPFADSSALPTYLICRAAREHVTVALTGDGGDEAFGGYDRYRAMRLAETMSPGRYVAVKLAAAAAGAFAPHDERNRLRRLIRFAAGLDDVPAEQYFRYRRLFSPAELPALLERDFARSIRAEDAAEWFGQLYEQGEYDDEVAYAQRHDIQTYLSDDLLVKADMASMAVSLELRSPMLDHEVMALGLSLPAACKIRRRQTKAVIADAFGSLLPASVFRRPKKGFGVPLDRWLREDLLDRLGKTLLDEALVERDWMSRPVLKRMIDDHMAGRADHRHRLWALFWLGRWLACQN
ncbi:MAG: asparagine synthetase B family protein, partial [Planctomycetota bacterium]